MQKVTDAEFEEFQALRMRYRKELARESAVSTSLEQDIDAPIRKSVMAFALLGCEPQWSCCGFDYEGQPIHKWHEYGRTFFNVEDNARSIEVVSDFFRTGSTGAWEAGRYERCIAPGAPVHKLIALKADFESKVTKPWDDKDCPHFPESAMINILLLENYLMSRSGEFRDESVLHDTNSEYNEHFQFWQYPPRGDWAIRKRDLLSEPATQRSLHTA